MAFAEQIYHEHCTGCSKCVVACPVDALGHHTANPVSNETICTGSGMKNQRSLAFRVSSVPGAANASKRVCMMVSG